MIYLLINIYNSLTNEMKIRLLSTIIIFVVMALWEIIFPKRILRVKKFKRWSFNIFITIFNSTIVQYILPVIPISLALIAYKNSWGLFNILNLPLYLNIILSIIIFDFVIYLQHVMFHALPILWRLHMMHHIDLDIDVTTALRFHPLEIILSIFIKLSVILIIGPAAISVLIFEIILNGTAMFNHSNIEMPQLIDKIIRFLIVTPDMHRVHHSVTIRETNSNFGFNFSFWDRFFGTYRAHPFLDHKKMIIGHSLYRNENEINFLKLFFIPFIGKPGNYSINRWGKDLNIK